MLLGIYEETLLRRRVEEDEYVQLLARSSLVRYEDSVSYQPMT